MPNTIRSLIYNRQPLRLLPRFRRENLCTMVSGNRGWFWHKTDTALPRGNWETQRFPNPAMPYKPARIQEPGRRCVTCVSEAKRRHAPLGCSLGPSLMGVERLRNGALGSAILAVRRPRPAGVRLAVARPLGPFLK